MAYRLHIKNGGLVLEAPQSVVISCVIESDDLWSPFVVAS